MYDLFLLFHSTRKGSFGPEPFSVLELEAVLTPRGYEDVEDIVNLLIAMDLVYRSWWHEKNKEQDG